jgi:hypothetical protein
VERPPDRTKHLPKKQRQTLFRVGHNVHRGYGDASRSVVYFRVVGPVKAGWDGSWKPGDFEEVKRGNAVSRAQAGGHFIRWGFHQRMRLSTC